MRLENICIVRIESGMKAVSQNVEPRVKRVAAVPPSDKRQSARLDLGICMGLKVDDRGSSV